MINPTKNDTQIKTLSKEQLIDLSKSIHKQGVAVFYNQQLNERELRVIVTKLINSMGAKSLKDMKDIMPKLMQQISGKGDGKMASNIVREILSR